jgi:hypothetical protein
MRYSVPSLVSPCFNCLVCCCTGVQYGRSLEISFNKLLRRIWRLPYDSVQHLPGSLFLFAQSVSKVLFISRQDRILEIEATQLQIFRVGL